MSGEAERKTEYERGSCGRRTAAVVLMIAAILFSVWFMQKFMCIPFSSDEIRIINFHKEPENSIDVLLVGSSASFSDFSSVYAYDRFGYTSFPYAIGGATCTMWKPAVKDALATQKPKLIVVDVFGGGYDRELIDTRSNQLSIVLSHTAWSREKVETAREESALVEQSSTLGFLFPFIKYHNNVPACIPSLPDRLRLELSGPSPLKGDFTKTMLRYLRKVDTSSFTDESVPVDEKTEAIITDFIDYCRSENIDVLFVKYPSVLTDYNTDELEVNLRANRVLEIAEENGCRSLNMQKLFHEIGLVEQEDFYNHGHTNIRGQKKVTEYLGRYIQDEMGIGPSELSDSVKEEWDSSIAWLEEFYITADERIEENEMKEYYDSPATLRELAPRVMK